MKFVYIDFEYNRPAEKHPNLVCAAWSTSHPSDDTQSIWLYNNPRNQKKLHNILLDYHKRGYTFVSFATTAEARCFYALRLDPVMFNWVDLYCEWRQLRNCYDKFNYGTYFVNNIKRRSVPPVYDRPHMNEGRDNTQLYYSLAACTGRLLKINIDKHLKTGMRDLILTAPEEFTPEEQADILEYCESDIIHLPKIHDIMNAELASALKISIPDLQPLQLKRGEFAAHVAIMESLGIPLDMEAARNLRKNVELAKDKLIQDLVDTHYPFFIRKKKRKRDLQGTWVDKYSQFAKYVEEELPPKLAETWKLTESGRYCADDDYLSSYDNVPAIYAYRQTRKLLNQLKWFREPDEGKEDLFDSIGSDGHLRTFFGIYGTQTARNAPQAKRFIFAMSAWLRCLIRPPKGYVITELDYASQEFAIGALLSEDPNMIEAYKSGDPYLYFAKKAKAVPPDGTKKTHKKERDLFKATTLGLQYGMGYRALAIKLSSDMGEEVSEARAQKLIDLHKRTYRIYWRWLQRIERSYARQGYLQLPCGWAMFKDNPQALSVRNFPTQGSGSSIIREAVRLLRKAHTDVIATLHDSVYIITREEDGEEPIDHAEMLLKKAFDRMLKQEALEIRIDRCSHTHEEVWVPEKGGNFYEMLKEYLGRRETREDKLEKLMNGVFS